jgi:hypothetical protein
LPDAVEQPLLGPGKGPEQPGEPAKPRMTIPFCAYLAEINEIDCIQLIDRATEYFLCETKLPFRY